MATAKPSRNNKPADSRSRVAQARLKLNANVSTKNRRAYEKEKEALEQTKLLEKAKKEYDKMYRLVTLAAVKQQAAMDAKRDAKRAPKPTRRRA